MSQVILGNQKLKFIKGMFYMAPPPPPPKPYVDLGLPSGTLWAKNNLGANSPEEQGDYYVWGYTSNGETDGFMTPDIQGTQYDIARCLLGNEWCLPNVDQYQELIDNCQFNYDDNGVNIIGPNGNMIYMPYSDSEWTHYMCSTSAEYARSIETFVYSFYLRKGQPPYMESSGHEMDYMVRPIYVGNN
jgi:hypothetical protein